jgi:hypothetical protein
MPGKSYNEVKKLQLSKNSLIRLSPKSVFYLSFQKFEQHQCAAHYITGQVRCADSVAPVTASISTRMLILRDRINSLISKNGREINIPGLWLFFEQLLERDEDG